MSLQFMDSVDHYTTISEMIAKWTWAQFATIVAGRNGQGILLQPGSGILSKSLKHKSHWFPGFAVYFNSGGGFGPDGSNFYVLSNTGQAIFLLKINADGSASLATAGPSGHVLGTTSTIPFYFHPGKWYFIEMDIQIAGGADVSVTASLKVDGNLLLNGVSGNTGLNSNNFVVPQGTANFHQFTGANVTGGIIYDDINIKDSDGTFCNNFIGDNAIFCVYPRADITTQWTGLVPGNQFSQINAHTPAGDGSYVYASQPPNSPMNALDNFAWEPIPTFFGTIFAIQMSLYARKDAEGTRAIQSVANGGVMTSDVFYLDDDYNYYIFPMSSNSGVQWDILAFNAMNFGFLIAV